VLVTARHLLEQLLYVWPGARLRPQASAGKGQEQKNTQD
jgi:hypothetical protein